MLLGRDDGRGVKDNERAEIAGREGVGGDEVVFAGHIWGQESRDCGEC